MKIQYLEPGQTPGAEPPTGHKRERGTGMDDEVKKIIIIGIITLVLIGLGLWGCSAGKKAPKEAEAQAPIVESLPTLTPTPPAVIEQPVSPLPTIDMTRQAAYSRPAANPEASPYLVGVITYEPGCAISNLGFTTAGLEGSPYYLYFPAPLDRDPLMQMVNVQGYVQRFDDCQYPVLMVSSIFWLNDAGTPAPLLAEYQPITTTLTGTVTAPAWGALPTPDKHATPIYNPDFDYVPAPKTPIPTYTPYPTYTPLAAVVETVIVWRDPEKTKTPTPSATPTNTATPSPTPETASVYGDIDTVIGCPVTNLAVINSGQQYYVILSGAQLPAGSPTDYWAMVTGLLDTVCNGSAIRASQIIWYTSPTPTMTPTPTVTYTPTKEPTVEPTTEPTAEPTTEP